MIARNTPPLVVCGVNPSEDRDARFEDPYTEYMSQAGFPEETLKSPKDMNPEHLAWSLTLAKYGGSEDVDEGQADSKQEEPPAEATSEDTEEEQSGSAQEPRPAETTSENTEEEQSSSAEKSHSTNTTSEKVEAGMDHLPADAEKEQADAYQETQPAATATNPPQKFPHVVGHEPQFTGYNSHYNDYTPHYNGYNTHYNGHNTHFNNQTVYLTTNNPHSTNYYGYGSPAAAYPVQQPQWPQAALMPYGQEWYTAPQAQYYPGTALPPATQPVWYQAPQGQHYVAPVAPPDNKPHTRGPQLRGRDGPPLRGPAYWHRRMMGLCIFCGNAGHYVRECPAEKEKQGKKAAAVKPAEGGPSKPAEDVPSKLAEDGITNSTENDRPNPDKEV